jgi:hypothetical protein
MCRFPKGKVAHLIAFCYVSYKIKHAINTLDAADIFTENEGEDNK